MECGVDLILRGKVEFEGDRVDLLCDVEWANESGT